MELMNVGAVGYTAYTSYMPGIKPAGAGYAQPAVLGDGYGNAKPASLPTVGQSTSPQPLAPSYNLYGQPAGIMYMSIDGDRVELSKPTASLIPEPEGNKRLDALKPEGECETCANRKYVDGSDDASVSYQTPTKISPGMAGSKVAAHEQEHVRNEQAKASREDRQVVNQSVTLKYDTCPECGRTYVSGGTTRTTTVNKKESPELDFENAESGNGDDSE